MWLTFFEGWQVKINMKLYVSSAFKNNFIHPMLLHTANTVNSLSGSLPDKTINFKITFGSNTNTAEDQSDINYGRMFENVIIRKLL